MKKFSNYAFWIAFVGALVVFLEDIESLFGSDINTTLVESLILSFCGILVVLGIVSKKEDSNLTNEEKNASSENVIQKQISEELIESDNIDDNQND